MKELSIEEKAQRYNEALKVAKDIRNGEATYIPNGTPVIEAIFPELKESEDEKIRKRIIQALHGDVLDMEETTKAIAWLEKQGEQKPLFKKGDTVIFDGEEFNILDVTKDSYNVGGYIIPIYRQNELLLKQNPAWSEEDEKEFEQLLEILHANGYKSFDIWLKSLKDRVQPQKQEWSKEEQQIIEDAACIILDCVNTAESEKEEKRLEELADKLQDLRPQNRWKPSNEQMHYLSWVANIKLGYGVVEQEVSKHLNELLEDLKKLRGE